MEKKVQAIDRRTWMVRSRISWTKPPMGDEFEHDMPGGYLDGVAMLGVLVALALFVVFWTPNDVVIPAWFVLLILLILLLMPLFWALQRPWIITAETAEPIESQGEYWEGIVRGIMPAREETERIASDLEEKGKPDDFAGPLMRMKPPGRDT